jgi:hypothetical protein
MKKKILQEVISTRTNEDGQVIEEIKSQVIQVEKEPDYVKLYINDLLRLQDIPKSANDILLAIIKRMTYNNDIALFAPVKREIASELNIKEVTVAKAIEMFTNKSILIRKDRGLYVINPYLFGRGKWEEIRKIRLQLVYSKEGRVILKTDFETSNDLKDGNSSY